MTLITFKGMIRSYLQAELKSYCDQFIIEATDHELFPGGDLMFYKICFYCEDWEEAITVGTLYEYGKFVIDHPSLLESIVGELP
jgi:hypothetical protein